MPALYTLLETRPGQPPSGVVSGQDVEMVRAYLIDTVLKRRFPGSPVVIVTDQEPKTRKTDFNPETYNPLQDEIMIIHADRKAAYYRIVESEFIVSF